MNIFYDNTIFYLQRHGGVSRMFSETIKRIAGYDGVHVGRLSPLGILPRRLIRLNTMYVDFRLAACGCDIYHPTYYSETVRKRRTVKKIVVTVHDMTHELFSRRFKEQGIGIEIKKSSILSADHLICVSHVTKRDLMEIYNIKESRISVIHHGVSLNGGVLATSKAGFKNSERPYILYVGKRDSYKNFNVLLRAFYKLGIKGDFDIACFGGGRFSPQEKAEFHRLKLKDSIKYIEGNDALLKFYYKNARIFVVTSLYEGFGMPILEAMGSDCPVIASSCGSVPEVAEDAALLFSPEDTDELSDSIKMLLYNKDRRDECIKKGRGRIKNFSWDKAALETYNVYKKVLSS